MREMRLVVLMGLALGQLGCGRVDAATMAPDASAVGEPECRRDSDCTIVPSTCCSCANDGQRRVVALTEAPRFTHELAARCEVGSYMCLHMVNGSGACAITAYAICRPEGVCDLAQRALPTSREGWLKLANRDKDDPTSFEP